MKKASPKSTKFLSDHVPKRQTCIKLQKAGFPQNTLFTWNEQDGNYWVGELKLRDIASAHSQVCAAPILSELIECLLSDFRALSAFIVTAGEFWTGDGNPIYGAMDNNCVGNFTGPNPVENVANLYLEWAKHVKK